MSNTSNQIELVQPIYVNGIEFYSSKITAERGLSQTGLARLCGVPESTLRRVLEGFSVRSFSPSESLNHLVGASLYLGISSANNAKVIDSKAAASLISYYAFERKNEVAKQSVQLFAAIGIDSWIDTITGSKPVENSNDTHELLKQVLAEVVQLKEKSEKYDRVKNDYPVLESWLRNLNEKEKENLLAPAKDDNTYTIKEALDLLFPGTSFSTTIHKKVALKCGQIIGGLTGEKLPKKETKNGYGYNMSVNSYTTAQLPLIELILKTIW
jgi:transcriptional regulator with XRE-family HTH domain